MGDSYDDLEAAQCRDCIKLREQVDELMKDKADAWELIEEFRHENSEQRCQLAAAQATNERLREAHYELAKAVRELLPMFCKDPEKFEALVESEAAIESVKREA